MDHFSCKLCGSSEKFARLRRFQVQRSSRLIFFESVMIFFTDISVLISSANLFKNESLMCLVSREKLSENPKHKQAINATLGTWKFSLSLSQEQCLIAESSNVCFF